MYDQSEGCFVEGVSDADLGLMLVGPPARNSRNSGAIAYMGIIVLFENKSGVPTLYYSQIEFASEVQNRAFPMLLRNRLPRFRRVLVEIL